MATSTDDFVLKGRYADRYRWENLTEACDGSDSRPTGLQIVQDEGLESKMTDKVFLVTGCSSGAGVTTVKSLAVTGATIFATARNIEKAKKVLGDILDLDHVHLLQMDNADFASVRACAAEFKKLTGGKLNVLICNAAVMATPYGLTKDGVETQFATNHLAHFLLFQLLKDTLIASSTPEFNSRVVVVSSAGQKLASVNFDNINCTDEGSYDPWIAYGQSKTAMIWFANQIERLYGAQGLHANSLMPGGWRSGLQQHLPQAVEDAMYADPKVKQLLGTVDQGCATSVWAAVSKDLEGQGGMFLEGCSVSGLTPPGSNMAEYGHSKWAFEPENEKKLWEVSMKMVNVRND
jgi:NAD(P)-dependent dehydrogenase (short-subunit alcohol dehydrogenase family)